MLWSDRSTICLQCQLLAQSGDGEYVVVFERSTRPHRQSLIRQLDVMGVRLRPFDDSDRRRAQVQVTSMKAELQLAAVLVLASPYLLVMRLRDRTTEMYAAALNAAA